MEHIDYQFFDTYVERFIKANADRYNYITEEVVHFVQQYRSKYEERRYGTGTKRHKKSKVIHD